MTQSSIFDFLPVEERDLSLGECETPEFVGTLINFNELKDYIGRKVIYRNEAGNYKLVKVVDFYEDHNAVYRKIKDIPAGKHDCGEYISSHIYNLNSYLQDCYEVAYRTNRVACSDRDKNTESNCSMDEDWCVGGRYVAYGLPEDKRNAFYTLNI